MKMSDILVIGGGPAGATAAIYGARGGKSVTLLYRDSGALGRAEAVGNYYGFPEPLSGEELFRLGLEQAKNVGVEVIRTQVLSLGFQAEGLTAETANEIYCGKAVILATGTSRKQPNLLGLKEYDGMGVSYCAVCDGFFCRGKAVAVLGAGEYALHEAGVLLPLASQVTLLTGGEAVPENLPEGLLVNSQPIESLEGADGILQGVRFRDGSFLGTTRLFVAIGEAGSSDLARKLGLVTDGNRIVTNEKMETNVPGLFSAGDCTGGLLQVAKAVSDGATAGLEALKYLRTQK